jgi:hypothetical protein
LKDLRKTERENPDVLRTEANYKEDVEVANKTLTGVAELCVFNSIPSFNVWENWTLDLMHDIIEGVAHYERCEILLYGLNIGYITIELLNTRKNSFNYGPTMIRNLAEDITIDNIKQAR